MQITSQTTPSSPQRFSTTHDTFIAIQIRGAFTITIGFEQNEVNIPGDGIQLTQANTSPPFVLRVRGDLWHISTVPNSQWVIVITAEKSDCE